MATPGSVKWWGWKTNTGLHLSHYELDMTMAEIDTWFADAVSSSLEQNVVLKFAAFKNPLQHYIKDTKLRNQLRLILRHTMSGHNWGYELHNHAGLHMLLDQDGNGYYPGRILIEPGAVTPNVVMPGMVEYQATGYTDYQDGSWVLGGKRYYIKTEPMLFDGGSYYCLSGLIIPLCVIMSSDGYVRQLNFIALANALGLGSADVSNVIPTPWGKDFKPNFQRDLLGVLGDDDNGNGDNEMRYYPRLSPGTVGAYRMEKEGVADILSDMWETDILETLRQGFIGDASNAVLGLNWFYGLRSLISVGEQRQVKMGNVVFHDSSPFAVVKDEFVDFSFGSITVPRYHGTYLDYTSVEYKMYLPFIGMIDLNPQDVVGQVLSLTYRINTTDGSAVCQLSRDSLFPDSPGLLFNASCMWAYEIPIRVDAGRSIGTAVVRTLSAGKIQGENASYDAGSLAANVNIMGDFEAKLFCYKRADLTDGEGKLNGTGLPSGASMTVGEASGYLQCSSVFNAATLPPRRTQEIIQLLRDGIYV